MGIHFGFQTYTWQMSYEKYRGRVGHILDITRKASLAGFESEVCMLGDYEKAPQRLADELSQRDLKLAAICYVADWRGAKETDAERAAADHTIQYVKTFPGTLLALCQMPGKDRNDLRERQNNALACVNAIARRAADQGIASAFHPNSPPGSVFRTQEDYNLMLSGLDAKVVGFVPDTGHIARGGMDPLTLMKSCRPLIKHVHFKDISAQGGWVPMGQGVTHYPAIVSWLAQTNYAGWIMIEDESPDAQVDPDAVALANGRYIHSRLLSCC
ncbi:MAG TPA: sugar phosphate isomerase/epimerase family protein [Planctomycetota bacterium]|jgi:inosose dehydratase